MAHSYDSLVVLPIPRWQSEEAISPMLIQDIRLSRQRGKELFIQSWAQEVEETAVYIVALQEFC